MSRKIFRCAIYTRKSSDEGLDQAFNSLDAQREAGEAYVKSQGHEGWKAIATLYDDGGFSGGSMERPALQRLLADVDAGQIDVVVVYKIDRLTRSLPDFARIVERFDAQGVSFVSVTQAFNTTSSMGRLTLNVLLSFAQFEREVTGERIRDKIAASKAKGMWMGGLPPLGYDLPADTTRTLRVNEAEAEVVREIFTRYLEVGSVHSLQRELTNRGILSKRHVTAAGRVCGGLPFSRGALFHLLRNPIYIGRIRHKDMTFEGEHSAIIEPALFDQAQSHLDQQARRHRAAPERRIARAPLTGKLFDATGEPMTPTYSRGQRGKNYRYYVSVSLQRGGSPASGGHIRRLPAPCFEQSITELLTRWQTHGDDPLAKLIAVRLCENGLLIDVAGNLAADIIPSLSPNEQVVHADKTSVRIRVEQALITRGGGKVIIAGERGARPDRALIAALRKAHSMTSRQRGLPTMTVAPVSAHDRKLLRLAFLAPELQKDILEGLQPRNLTLEKLRYIEIPLCWKAQRRELGWPAKT